MISLLNPASLLLGLIAWILPIVNIVKYKNSNSKNSAIIYVVSIGACAISILLQILYSNHLVNIMDWTALMDTIGVSVFLSSVLLIVTIVLNVITLILHSYRSAK